MSLAGKGKMSDKENAPGSERSLKPSRIPRPVAWSQHRAPLTPHNSHTTPSTSCVRRVPNFDKLHKSFQLQMVKMKQKKKATTQFKTFDLTPAGPRGHSRRAAAAGEEMEMKAGKESEKRREEGGGRQGDKSTGCGWEGEGSGDQPAVLEEKNGADRDRGRVSEEVEFEPRPDCLQAILQDRPLEPQAGALRPTDTGLLTRGQSKTDGVALSPGRQIRLSVYTKRDRALRKLLQYKASGDAGIVAPGSRSVSRGNEFSHLLQKMVQSTATSMRTVSRLAREGAGGGEDELDGVRVRLESQLTEAESVISSTSLCTLTSAPQDIQSHLTRPHPQTDTFQTYAHTRAPWHPSHVTAALDHCSLSKSSFYCEEPELCEVVWKAAGAASEARGGLRAGAACPLASLLERCYITSLTELIARDNVTSRHRF